MNTTYIIIGQITCKRTHAGIAGLRVELWDKDLLADDLVGTTSTDSDGKFKVEFDENYFKELCFDNIPDIFIKLFDGQNLIFSSENERVWNLKSGETEIKLELDLPDNQVEERLLDLYVLESTAVYSKPGGQQVMTLAPGSWIVALEVKEGGFVIKTDQGQTGWVAYEDLTDLHRKIHFFNGEIPAKPILKPEIINTVWKELCQCDLQSLNSAGKKLQTLDELLHLSQGVVRNDLEEVSRFDTLLLELINQFEPPIRPKNFTLTTLRNEVDIQSLGVSGFFRNPGFPCFPNLDSIGLLGSAIFHSARRRSPVNPAVSADLLWSSLWVLGDLLNAANQVGTIYQSLERGYDEITKVFSAGFANHQMDEAGCLSSLGRFQSEGNIVPVSMPWEPGRFPGDFRFPAFDCRFEQWDRSRRAIRCCGQTYQIDSVTTDGCFGDVVIIRGSGFSNSRFWPFEHTPGTGEPSDPAHLATPGPIENKVIFLATDGEVLFGEGFVPFVRDAGTPDERTYQGWADDEIRVLLPVGAISGELELRIVCDETFSRTGRDGVIGRRVAPDCGIQTRLPNHDPIDARVLVRAAVVSVSVTLDGGSRSVGVDGLLELDVEACVGIPIVIDGIHLREVIITDSSGSRVLFSEGELGIERPIDASVIVAEARDETYTITTLDACDSTQVFTIVLNRYHTCHLTTSRGTYNLATETEVPVTCRLSCDPDDLDLDSMQVRLSLAGSPPPAIITDEILTIPAGTVQAATTIALSPPSCGTYRVNGEILEDGIRRRPCFTDFNIIGLPIISTFTAGVVVRLFSPTGTMSPLLRPRYTGRVTATLSFSIDRSTVTITGLMVTGIRFVTIRQQGGGVGTYNCRTGALSIPIILEIDGDILGSTFVNDGLLSTGTLSTISGMLSGMGSPTDSMGTITIVGAGTGTGGVADGLEVFITLTGTMTPVSPPCCGSV